MGKIIKAGVEHYFSGGIGSGSDIVILTQEEYDELVTNNTVESGVYYFIEDVNIEGGNNVVNDASDIIYDNSTSGLEADNVQDAVDEVNGKVDEISNDITELNQKIGDKTGFPNYGRILASGNVTYTATEDCYFSSVVIVTSAANDSPSFHTTVNNIDVTVVNSSAGNYVYVANGYAKKGDVINLTGGGSKIYALY